MPPPILYTSPYKAIYPLYIIYAPYDGISADKGIILQNGLQQGIKATKLGPFDTSSNWTGITASGNNVTDVFFVSAPIS